MTAVSAVLDKSNAETGVVVAIFIGFRPVKDVITIPPTGREHEI